VSDVEEITLPYIPDAMIRVEDMLGKVPKLRYYDPNVRDVEKFPNLAEETGLAKMGEIGPLGRPIFEPVQWITRIYNLSIMKLLDIPHFWHGKNVGLSVKQLLAQVHGIILWMDSPVPIDVALISNIIGFPTVGAQPKEYLENKA
jgi:hypothetical protein